MVVESGRIAHVNVAFKKLVIGIATLVLLCSLPLTGCSSGATDADVTVEDGQYGTYISAINGLAAEGSSGWVYTVNGEQVMESVDACPVADGDTVEFSYITM